MTMKRMTAFISLVAVIALAVGLSGCLEKKTKVVEIILTAETCGEWPQDSADEIFEDSDTINVSDELNSALASANVSRDSILAATILGGAYGSTSFTRTGPDDWEIWGSIDVERVGGASATIINYASASVVKSLHQKIPAPLTAAGVAVLQDALDDYLAGDDNVLVIYKINNGDVRPDPSPQEHIVFTWKAWINIQVTVPTGFELIDPWGSDSPAAP
jgi:hypothetical protein